MRILLVVSGIQVHRRAGTLARRRGRQAIKAASHGRSSLDPDGKPDQRKLHSPKRNFEVSHCAVSDYTAQTPCSTILATLLCPLWVKSGH